MKIILKQDVDNVGDAGDIVEVANGYAQNYLIPQNLAMRATRGAEADAEALRRSRLKREAGNIAQAEEVKTMLQGRPLVVTAKAGADGTLYGSVGKREIAALITSQTGVKVDHKKLPLERPLKSVGQHPVEVRLHREVSAEVIIDVVGEDMPEDETDETAAAAAQDASSDADSTTEDATDSVTEDTADSAEDAEPATD